MIETTRLILRPFREEDAADVFEYLEKPTVNCFACMKLNSLEEAQAAVKEKMAHSEYCFALVHSGTPCGLRWLSHGSLCGKTAGICGWFSFGDKQIYLIAG